MTKHLSFVSTIALAFVLAITVALISAAPSVGATALTNPADLEAGDLIRGESFSAVYYYGADGFRYVFPNDKAYFTWYDNFDDVLWLADSDLSDVQIGGNVTYKPGIKMIKITSDPRVYTVGLGGEIHAITSEEVAEELYGSSWNTMIDDVPDGFFPNYTIGSELEFASQFDPASEESGAYDIDYDKSLVAYTSISITDSTVNSATIDVGTAVRFINNGTDKHGASAEDGSWGSGTINVGEHFSRYFDEVGEYDYYDKYETSNTGTITVE